MVMIAVLGNGNLLALVNCDDAQTVTKFPRDTTWRWVAIVSLRGCAQQLSKHVLHKCHQLRRSGGTRVSCLGSSSPTPQSSLMVSKAISKALSAKSWL